MPAPTRLLSDVTHRPDEARVEVLAALAAAGGDVTAAAAILGVSRWTVYEAVRRLGILLDDAREAARKKATGDP